MNKDSTCQQQIGDDGVWEGNKPRRLPRQSSIGLLDTEKPKTPSRQRQCSSNNNKGKSDQALIGSSNHKGTKDATKLQRDDGHTAPSETALGGGEGRLYSNSSSIGFTYTRPDYVQSSGRTTLREAAS